MTTDAVLLKDAIVRLGPWHLDVDVTPEISTRAFMEASERVHDEALGRVSFIDARGSFRALMQKIYPDGLEGRRFLDCACNCGGYSFWARELGASSCFGFDVREHWVTQARFLAQHRTAPSDAIRFEVSDLYDLPTFGLEPFDITLFKGIFYHLPDPITGLKIAADLTKELIIVNTATRNGLPDGVLAIAEESRTQLMSGVHGLNWYPSGPEVVIRILKWLGFADAVCTYWSATADPNQPEGLGRLEIVASRTPGLLDSLRTKD